MSESESTTPIPAVKSPEERRALLAQRVAREVASGARVEAQTDIMAVIVRGHRTNHVLHFLVSLFTIGFWLPVWFLLTIFGGEKRSVLTVDDYGNIVAQKS